MISCDTRICSFVFRFLRFSFSVCLVMFLSVWVPFFSQGLFSGMGELSRYTYPADFWLFFFYK
jgi:hypothetical protein